MCGKLSAVAPQSAARWRRRGAECSRRASLIRTLDRAGPDEGADLALNFLPGDSSDADKVQVLIAKAGRQAVSYPGNRSARNDMHLMFKQVATIIRQFPPHCHARNGRV
jgi:hypothetical protein